MNPVAALIDELQEDPRRFRSRGGYERLLEVLREGHPPDAVKAAVSQRAELAADLLWTIAELENVAEFVTVARPCLRSTDKATAAYAMEIVLRGASDGQDVRAALDALDASDEAVCEHAVRTLAGEGTGRIRAILQMAAYPWARVLGSGLTEPVPRTTIEEFIAHDSRTRQVVGLALATLAWEREPTFAEVAAQAAEDWIRDYAAWLANREA